MCSTISSLVVDNIIEAHSAAQPGSLSLTSQTAQKYGKVFCYCLPSSDNLTGYLIFGSRGEEDSKQVKKHTPSSVNPDYPSFYFLSMEGISVAGKRLAIPTSVFASLLAFCRKH